MGNERENETQTEALTPVPLGSGAIRPNSNSKVALNAAGDASIARVLGDGDGDGDDEKRKRDEALIAATERKLLGKASNTKLKLAERKAALRDVICAHRGVVYATLPIGDAQRVAIDAAVDQRYSELLATEARAKEADRLDATVDNAKLPREKRMDAFFAEYLMAQRIDLAKKAPEEQAKLRADFDAKEAMAFDLRDEVMKARKINLLKMNNRKLSYDTRLAAYRVVFHGTYELSTQRRYETLTPDEKKVIDARFDTEFVPKFKKQDADDKAAIKKRADGLARAKVLERQLRAKLKVTRFAWGSLKTYVVPDLPDVFREIMVLRSGQPASSATVARAVASYHSHVGQQNAASAKKLSAANYFDVGFRSAGSITHENIVYLFHDVKVPGTDVSLADAMFPGPGLLPLIAGSQRTPILIRAGALLHGEKASVLDALVVKGQVLYRDLVGPIVLLTSDVMNRYLDLALIEERRAALPVEQQLQFQEYVLHAYQDDQKLGPGQESLYQMRDVQIAGVDSIVGKMTSIDGKEIKAGDLNAQTSDMYRRAAVASDAKLKDLQSARDEAQDKVDALRKKEWTPQVGGPQTANSDMKMPEMPKSSAELRAAEESLRQANAAYDKAATDQSSYRQTATLIDEGVFNRVGKNLVVDEKRQKELFDAQQVKDVTASETERKRKEYHPELRDTIDALRDPSWFTTLWNVANLINPLSQVAKQLKKVADMGEDIYRDGWSFDKVSDADIKTIIAEQNALALSPKEVAQIKRDAADCDQRLGKGLSAFGPGGIAEGFANLERNFAGVLRFTSLVTGVDTGWQGYAKDAAKVDMLSNYVGGGDEQAFYATALKVGGEMLVTAPKMMVLSLLPGGIVTASALDSATQAGARGQNLSETVTAATTGALMGIVFEGSSHLASLVEAGTLTKVLPSVEKMKLGTEELTTAGGNRGAALLSKVLGEGTRLGSIAAGTIIVDTAAGKDLGDSLHAALCNVMLEVSMRVGGGLPALAGRIVRVFTHGEEIDLAVDQAGNVRRYEKVPAELVDAELIVNDQSRESPTQRKVREQSQTTYESDLAAYYEAKANVDKGGKLKPQQRDALDKQLTDAASKVKVDTERKSAPVVDKTPVVEKQPVGAPTTAVVEVPPLHPPRMFELMRDADGEVVDFSEDSVYLKSKDGRQVNSKGYRVDDQGHLLHVDAKGNAVDFKGQPIEDASKYVFVDEAGNAVDAKGVVIDPKTGLPLSETQNAAIRKAEDGVKAQKAMPVRGTIAGTNEEIAFTGTNLNTGSGSSSDIWEATMPSGERVVVKAGKGKSNSAIADSDYRNALEMAAVGGPKVFGKAEFSRNGEIYAGVVLERVEGIDVGSLMDGKKPSFAITKKHVEAMEKFAADMKAGKIDVSEANPGDFILTPDGRVVPTDLMLMKVEATPNNTVLQGVVTKFREWVDGHPQVGVVAAEVAPVSNSAGGSTSSQKPLQVEREGSSRKVILGESPDYQLAETMLHDLLVKSGIAPDATLGGSYVRTKGGTDALSGGKPFRPLAWPKGITYEEALALTKAPVGLSGDVVAMMPADAQQLVHLKSELNEQYGERLTSEARAKTDDPLPSDIDVGVSKLDLATEAKLPAIARQIFEQTGVLVEFVDVVPTEKVENQRRLSDVKDNEAKTEAAKNDAPLPTMDNDDAIIREIAKRGERWANNKFEGTCATAAMKNTVSAQLAGYEAYVMEFNGWSHAAEWVSRLNLDPDGLFARVFSKLGIQQSAHAIAAVKGADGAWRYISWGRVETDWQVFAKEAFPGRYEARGEWNTGEHVKWMVDHSWEYEHPTTKGLVMRALLGWTVNVGK
ncbi:MAG: hypothetical protein ABI321_09445 [Polyangia bacterium]